MHIVAKCQEYPLEYWSQQQVLIATYPSEGDYRSINVENATVKYENSYCFTVLEP